MPASSSIRKEAQYRVYKLRPEPLAEVDEWLSRIERCGKRPERPAHRNRSRKEGEGHDMTEETRAGVPASREGCDPWTVGAPSAWRSSSPPTSMTYGRPDHAKRLARWIAEVEGDLRLGGGPGDLHQRWEGPADRRVRASPTPGRDQEPRGAEETSSRPSSSPTATQRPWCSRNAGSPSTNSPPTARAGRRTLEDLAAHGAGRGTCTDWHTRWTELTPFL